MHVTTKKVFFTIKPHEASGEGLEKLLFPGWQLIPFSTTKDRLDFYDTFEWNAFEKEIVIVNKKTGLSLIDLNTGHQSATVEFDQTPSFFSPDELPQGKLKEVLSSYTGIRAFIRLCSIDALIQSYHILDDNEKTIAVLTCSLLSFSNNTKHAPFASLFSLVPLKGYHEEIAKMALHESLESALDFKELFLLIMAAAGQNVQGYSSKINLALDPDSPIHNSTQKLLRFTLSILNQNEYGIKKNIDSEFLHDYRVAVRRTRSILKQLKGVYDPQETSYFLNAFKELGKQTNELRDRDVYLLKQGTYFQYLPAFLQPSLQLFFRDIEASRRTLQKQFCRYLASDTYLSFLEKWYEFVNRKTLPDPELAPNASLSTITVGVETIKKAWKKVIRHGRQISSATTDAELHALRIDCKKLRYLLEFFASIFPHKTITPVIRQMKELQENLGDFVDFSVQLQFLHIRLTTMTVKEEERLFPAAMGGLMATLFQKQEEARRKFHKTFRSFDNDETAQLFHDLLKHTSVK